MVSAHAINHGEVPDLEASGETSDFYFINREEPEAARATIVELVAERIASRFGFDPVTEVQVLAPMHRGDLGTAALNKALQDKLNPSRGGTEMTRGERTYRRGDKVMQLRNDYDKGVFNGDIGVLATVDGEAGTLSVDFDGKNVIYERSELDQLVHAYAVSIHKSQGSEYPAVVLPLATQHYMMLQRSLLYTAGDARQEARGDRRFPASVRSGSPCAMRTRSVRYTWLAERVRVRCSPRDRRLASIMETTCCIVGGGPAGLTLGWLLARAGVDVIVLEKHCRLHSRLSRRHDPYASTLDVLAEPRRTRSVSRAAAQRDAPASRSTSWASACRGPICPGLPTRTRSSSR